jgi:hypothetical protein
MNRSQWICGPRTWLVRLLAGELVLLVALWAAPYWPTTLAGPLGIVGSVGLMWPPVAYVARRTRGDPPFQFGLRGTLLAVAASAATIVAGRPLDAAFLWSFNAFWFLFAGLSRDRAQLQPASRGLLQTMAMFTSATFCLAASVASWLVVASGGERWFHDSVALCLFAFPPIWFAWCFVLGDNAKSTAQLLAYGLPFGLLFALVWGAVWGCALAWAGWLVAKGLPKKEGQDRLSAKQNARRLWTRPQ